jgi:hypothetical protein
MGGGWLLLAVMAAIVVIIWLSVLLIRLRLELWANRRVIAALEHMGVQPEKKSKSSGVVLVYGSLFLLTLWVILFQLMGK